ncbi:hypothetical protein ScalyP_jg10055 [Parmales sp. scaly parma]|nr:hypothetical protein ScalyP_jg10055 [Parmales sp. scaly parma]
MFLLTTTEPSAAVDSWLKDNKELENFVADNIWFEPMMNVIAKELLKKSNLGLKARVVLGAFLSIGDMITDIFVIRDYMNNVAFRCLRCGSRAVLPLATVPEIGQVSTRK